MGRINSMCAVYADLIEHELDSDEPDMSKVRKLLGYIRRYCHLVGFEKGEVPKHLEKHLIKEGSRERGTTAYRGKVIPKSAAELAKSRKKLELWGD